MRKSLKRECYVRAAFIACCKMIAPLPFSTYSHDPVLVDQLDCPLHPFTEHGWDLDVRADVQVVLVDLEHFVFLFQLVVGLFCAIDLVHDLCESEVVRGKGYDRSVNCVSSRE